MARYKKLATVLDEVDYKKPYKTTKKNAILMFNVLNHAIFNGKLELPEIRIRKLRGALGEYCYDTVDPDLIEITLSPKYQNMKHFINVLGHEMVHHYQYTIQGDTGNHNQKFYRWRKKFEKMGLELSRVA
tara:strand:- start:528 stop:917 length:390 start_codon:yes stop_codon:yes gene_type:complete